MKAGRKKTLLILSAIQLVSLLVFFIIKDLNVTNEIENRTWDWRVKTLSHYTPHNPDIKLIIIDQNSIDYLADKEKLIWPWPRELYTSVLGFLQLSGAKGLAIDLLFTENSHYGDRDDEALAKAIMASPLPVVLAVAPDNVAGRENLGSVAELQKNISSSVKEQGSYLPLFKGALLPVPMLLSSSPLLGSVYGEKDSDGIYRGISPLHRVRDISILPLSLALTAPDLRQNYPSEKKYISFTDSKYQKVSFISVLLSYKQVLSGLAPIIPLETFKNSYVFLGSNAPGLLDLRPTPLSGNTAGVEFHANTLDNFLNDKFIRKATTLENLLLLFPLLALLPFMALLCVRATLQIGIVLISLIVPVGASVFLAYSGIWILTVAPLAAILFSVIAAFIASYQLEGGKVRFLRKAFDHYVSPEMIERMVANPETLALGGERKELTLFFSDIAEFTRLSESLPPEQLSLILTDYLSVMTDTIISHGGTLDKYVGDAIVAFWNAPISVENHAEQALQSAIECQKKLDDLNQKLLLQYNISLSMRIGLHTGEVIVGNFGSVDRFNYTAVGDAVNLASRLEGVNKVFGTKIILSEQTFNKVQSKLDCIQIATVTVVGREAPVAVYSPTELFEVDSEIWGCLQDAIRKGGKVEEILQQLPAGKTVNCFKHRFSSGEDLTLWELKDK